MCVLVPAFALALGTSSRKLLHGLRMPEDLGEAVHGILRRSETLSHYTAPMAWLRCPFDIEAFEAQMRPVDQFFERIVFDSVIFGPML
jgi:hypothetical protein